MGPAAEGFHVVVAMALLCSFLLFLQETTPAKSPLFLFVPNYALE